MSDKHVRRAYRLLDEALDPDTADPWWRIDEAHDELSEVIDDE